MLSGGLDVGNGPDGLPFRRRTAGRQRCDAAMRGDITPRFGSKIGSEYYSAMPSRPRTVIIVPVIVAISLASPSAPIAYA